MAASFRLDYPGVGQILRSAEVRALVDGAAAKVAANVGDWPVEHGSTTAPVEVSTSTSDRARATVTIAHAAGQAIQAKHGALTKAAAAAGLEVRG